MLTNYLVVFVHIRNKGVVPSNMFKFPSIFFTGRSNAVLLSWIIFVILSLPSYIYIYIYTYFVCVCHTVLPVPCSLLVTCWERADLLALSCMLCFMCFFTNFPILSWVISCGICLFRFLMFAVFLTMMYACDIIYVRMFLYFSWNVIVFLLTAYMCWSYYFS